MKGDAGREEGLRGCVRHQGLEEGRDRAGRRRRVHHDREEDPRPRRQPPLPHITPLLFPDKGQCVGATPTRRLDFFIIYLAIKMAKTVRYKANFFILTFKNLLILNIQLRCIPASKMYPAAYFS